ncbi:hypothetical protein [Klebsiella pneumoniae IS22]|nr:hypothetical protein [Klebsiella pneumoniae IS22]
MIDQSWIRNFATILDFHEKFQSLARRLSFSVKRDKCTPAVNRERVT